jgi:hypothetical protein
MMTTVSEWTFIKAKAFLGFICFVSLGLAYCNWTILQGGNARARANPKERDNKENFYSFIIPWIIQNDNLWWSRLLA